MEVTVSHCYSCVITNHWKAKTAYRMPEELSLSYLLVAMSAEKMLRLKYMKKIFKKGDFPPKRLQTLILI